MERAVPVSIGSLKRTAFMATQRQVETLQLEEELTPEHLVKMFLEGQTKGSLNYVRATLKRKGILHSVIKKDLVSAITHPVSSMSRSKTYQDLCTHKILERTEIARILKDIAVCHPEKTFASVQSPNSSLVQVFKVTGLDISDAIAIVAKSMLAQNEGRVLEYIGELNYSTTLKYLIKDVEGMTQLVGSITKALTANIQTVEDTRTMIGHTIDMHTSLVKIDYTRVLLSPILFCLKAALSEKLVQFGEDRGAETLFYSISKRIKDIVMEDPSEKHRQAFLGGASAQGDILDFLLSLVPYDNMIETLALSVTQDLVVRRECRDVFLRSLESKMGPFRMANIHIIKKDFEQFVAHQVSPKQVFEDTLPSILEHPKISLGKNALISSFVYSQHYWPKNNFFLLEEIETPPKHQAPKHQAPAKQRAKPEKIALDYTKNHTYVDILIEHHSRKKNITIPIIYLIYIDGDPSKEAPEQLLSTIARFWARTRRQMETEG
ncbi:hypothetical protein NEDG_00829 [Nematocida displodere]|uniref:Uncharacterized protein n=1 Tax=Nematocida displodere TaxID=1805483 RepID=A0A177ED95_9MICR|nr:hypothetical protein NEDG_00829 [Nematocida displodere]